MIKGGVMKFTYFVLLTVALLNISAVYSWTGYKSSPQNYGSRNPMKQGVGQTHHEQTANMAAQSGMY